MRFLIILCGYFIYAHNSSANVDLDSAYKREYIFLQSQIRELNTQKLNLEKNFKNAVKQAKFELDKKQEELIALNANNEKYSDKLFKLEQNMELSEQNKSVLENTLKQASISLKIKDLPANSENLPMLFEKSLEMMKGSSKISHNREQFYLENGEQVSGEIIHFGKIATLGYFHDYFILAPAGQGQLKVWRKIDTKVGEAIFKGDYPSVFPLFIYEGLERAVNKKEDQSMVEFIKSGGSIAWVIVAMGIFSLFLCLVRMINLKLYDRETLIIENSCDHSNLDETKKHLENLKSFFGQKNLFLKILNSNVSDKEIIHDIIDEGMIHEHKLIDRFGSLILVLAAIAPLMGLLGTVTGMISTFDIITEFGTGDPKLLSKGISEALITTELGLIVAIPSLLFGNILSGWGKNIKMTLDKLVLKIVNDL